MKTKFTLFRRGEVYYTQDSATGRQTSLKTKDGAEAQRLLNATNEAHRQPVLNLQIARAYLTASDPAFADRTWAMVMEQFQLRGKDSSKERYASVFKSRSFNGLRDKKLLETTADDFFAIFKEPKVSASCFLKRLHSFALNIGWIPVPIVAPYLWPKYKAKPRRGITREEHEKLLAGGKKAEWKLFLQLLWEVGASQSDAIAMTAEDVDWQSRTVTYFRMKTGTKAHFTISKALEKVLQHLPTTGALFPNLSLRMHSDRASRFRRRCKAAGITGVTLHSYRYAWAERARTCGYPERFAQEALGHQSKAVHRGYARKAHVVIPTLEAYEQKQAANDNVIMPMPEAAAA